MISPMRAARAAALAATFLLGLRSAPAPAQPAPPPDRAFELRSLLDQLRRAPDSKVDGIVNRLLFLDSGQVAPEIASLLGSADTRSRIRASYALGFFDAPELASTVVAATRDPDWEVRRNAVYALGRWAVPATAKAVAARLADPRREVRFAAAQALRTLGAKDAVPALLRALGAVGDEDLELEIALLRALGAAPNRAARTALRARLEAPSEALRLAALEALLPLGDAKARAMVEAQLSAPQAYVRVDAARLLARVARPWARELLAARLQDPEPKVRLAAAESLAAQKDSRGLRYLLRVREGDDGRAALAAADALARVGAAAAETAAARRAGQEEADGDTRPPQAKEAGLGPAGADAGTPLPRWQPPDDFGPLALARRLAREQVPFTERLAALSAHFRGVPYLDSPLGEGAGYDPDPLYRFDAVDCLTYVEQVLALANAPDDPLGLLSEIRYSDGRIAFGRRNHLMMAQWIPNNIQKGFVRDITEEVGGDRVEWVEKTVSPTSWAQRRGVDLPLRAEEVPMGTRRLPIVPIERFPEVMDRIPDGALLLVVRTEIPLRPYRVTHLGFVFRKGDALYLRHAAKAGYGRVVDERLETFVRRNAKYRKWPVAGFNLLLPLPRSRAVTARRSSADSAGERAAR